MTSTPMAPETSDLSAETPPPAAPPTPFGDLTPRPWRRYVARMLDTVLGQLVAGLLIGLFAPALLQALQAADNTYFWYLAGCAVAIPLEALLLMQWGTTPAKALFGLRVVQGDGQRLSFRTAVARTLQVWFFGMGIGFPLVSLFTMAHAKNVLEREQRTSWDRDLGCVVPCARA